MLLLNNKKVVYNDEDTYEEWKVHPFTSYHWLELEPSSPQLTTVTYSRERVYKMQTEFERFMGVEEEF